MFYKVIFHDITKKYKFFAKNLDELYTFIRNMISKGKFSDCIYIVIPLRRGEI